MSNLSDRQLKILSDALSYWQEQAYDAVEECDDVEDQLANKKLGDECEVLIGVLKPSTSA